MPGVRRGDGVDLAGRMRVHHAPEHQADYQGERQRHGDAPVGPVPFLDLDRSGHLEHLGGRDRLRRSLGRVIFVHERLRVRANGPGNAADMAPGIEVPAARGVVAALDPPNDRLPDAGPLTHLRKGETGLAASLCQGVTDTHDAPPLLRHTVPPGGAGTATEICVLRSPLEWVWATR